LRGVRIMGLWLHNRKLLLIFMVVVNSITRKDLSNPLTIVSMRRLLNGYNKMR